MKLSGTWKSNTSAVETGSWSFGHLVRGVNVLEGQVEEERRGILRRVTTDDLIRSR